jgi:hypothetical protein
MARVAVQFQFSINPLDDDPSDPADDDWELECREAMTNDLA